MKPLPRAAAYGCLALSMALVGSYVALSKPLAAALPVFLLGWMRFGIGVVAMLRWLPKPANEPAMTGRTRGLVFMESFFGNFLFTVCMLFGVSMTSAVSAGVILSAIPAVVALMSWVFLRERIGVRVWAGAGCAMVGIGLLALSKGEHVAHVDSAESGNFIHKTSWLGDALVMGAVLCESAYAVIGKQLTGVLGPKRIASLINLWGFALMTPMGLYYAWSFNFNSVDWSLWMLLIFYALAASVWTVWLWMTGLKTVPASQSGVFTVMLPLSAATVGVLFLGESLDGMQMVAFTVALLGVVLATWPGAAAPSERRVPAD